MTQPVKAGDTKLHVESPNRFEIGDLIQIGNECGKVKGFGSIELEEGLRNDHPPGTLVTRIEGRNDTGTDARNATYGPGISEDVDKLYDSLAKDKSSLNTIKQFDGTASKFEYWRDQMKSHIARGRPWLVNLLEWAKNQKHPITVEKERGLEDAQFNVETVSATLYDFIGIQLGESMTYLRKRTVVNTGHENRGLELWRLLLDEFDNQAHNVIQGMIPDYTEPKQTKSLSTLEKDLDAWTQLGRKIESAGAEHQQTDSTKARALFRLVPDKQREYFMNGEMDSFQMRHDYIRRLITNVKNNLISDHKSGGINGLDEDEDNPETWSDDTWSQVAFSMGYCDPPTPDEWQHISYAVSQNKGRDKGKQRWLEG